MWDLSWSGSVLVTGWFASGQAQWSGSVRFAAPLHQETGQRGNQEGNRDRLPAPDHRDNHRAPISQIADGRRTDSAAVPTWVGRRRPRIGGGVIQTVRHPRSSTRSSGPRSEVHPWTRALYRCAESSTRGSRAAQASRARGFVFMQGKRGSQNSFIHRRLPAMSTDCGQLAARSCGLHFDSRADNGSLRRACHKPRRAVDVQRGLIS